MIFLNFDVPSEGDGICAILNSRHFIILFYYILHRSDRTKVGGRWKYVRFTYEHLNSSSRHHANDLDLAVDFDSNVGAPSHLRSPARR